VTYVIFNKIKIINKYKKEKEIIIIIIILKKIIKGGVVVRVTPSVGDGYTSPR